VSRPLVLAEVVELAEGIDAIALMGRGGAVGAILRSAPTWPGSSASLMGIGVVTPMVAKRRLGN
jgi:hypothetical protein